MISIEEAIHIIQKNIPPPQVQQYSLDEALGKHLAEDIYAPEPSPRYTNSAMDGYAARWDDINRADHDSPALLKLVGESQAGTPFSGQVYEGEAVRISTGAMMADGCDTVVRVEDTKEQGATVSIFAVHKKGQDVRYCGEEFQTGDILLHKHSRISSPQAGLLSAVGIDKIRAYKPCDVTILVTGSELVSAGNTIADHQIRDSNMVMMMAAVNEAGGNVVSCHRVTDDREATIAAIGKANSGIVICTGGVSVGRHDHVKDAAEANGFQPLFWRIRQKPGKPLYCAKKGDSLLFGLPGNPVSAFMCFIHYLRPVIGTLNGLPFGWPTVSGKAAETIVNRGQRTNMIRVQLTWQPNGGYCITNTEKQGSHMLTSLSNADGYIILEPKQVVKAGQRVDVYRYSFLREPV